MIERLESLFIKLLHHERESEECKLEFHYEFALENQRKDTFFSMLLLLGVVDVDLYFFL